VAGRLRYIGKAFLTNAAWAVGTLWTRTKHEYIRTKHKHCATEASMLDFVKDFMALVSLTAFGGVTLLYLDMMPYLV
jgi:hypothetical protein